MTRDEWLNSRHGRAVVRPARLTKLVEQALAAPGVEPLTGGKTIGQVYTELAATTDYTLQEVIDCFIKLRDWEHIYQTNTNEPTENAKWRIMQ